MSVFRIPSLTRVTLAATAALSALALQPALAAPDAALLEAARAAQPAVLQSLREMVAIESGTMDAPGIARMTDYAEKRLKALGGQVERDRKSTRLNSSHRLTSRMPSSA
jgi:glutamate carboxypeptidase